MSNMNEILDRLNTIEKDVASLKKAMKSKPIVKKTEPKTAKTTGGK
jgi:hypothetical protein